MKTTSLQVVLETSPRLAAIDEAFRVRATGCFGLATGFVWNARWSSTYQERAMNLLSGVDRDGHSSHRLFRWPK